MVKRTRKGGGKMQSIKPAKGVKAKEGKLLKGTIM